MPCARCGSWEEFPSWHPCEDACANAQGTATLHTGEEIRCNKSWDGTWWFFFCNTCKQTRPHIRGVLRGARIYLRMEHTDYITDSENSSYYCSSEGESCTQEEAEYFFFLKNNGRLLTPQMAKVPGGGTGIMKTGSSNQNLETGHNSLTQKVVNHTGVILMGAVSVPPWILG